jgi:hypothetical protein
MVVAGFAMIVLLAPAIPAQPPVKPGPEHAYLKKLEGTWEAIVKSPQGEWKATATYKMELGGLWLVSNFRGEFMGQTFQRKGLDTYDPGEKKYISVWIDSMSTTPMILAGTLDKDGKILTRTGERHGLKLKMVSEMKDEDTMVFTMSEVLPRSILDKDIKDLTILTMNYKRKKEARR